MQLGREAARLVVDRFEIDGDEFAVFVWGVDEVPVNRAVLTDAERSVLAELVAGASNAAIARSRSSSVRTVANQVASLLRKLGAESRFDLIRRYGQDHEQRHGASDATRRST